MRHMIFSASCLSALKPGHDYRPALDEIAGLGFNAARVFAGRLTWCGQEPQHALDRLPEFLNEAHARGLNGHVVALTDTAVSSTDHREAYPRRQHYEGVLSRLSPFDVLEGANEPWDVEQYELTPSYLNGLPRRHDVVMALGAAQSDESSDYDGSAPWVTSHLDRGRDVWNMVRRVQELRTRSANIGRHVMSGEMIGAGEHDEPGKRCADPAIFYTAAALGQLFGVSTCFHSTDGLHAQRLGPNQRRCAEAFMRGVRAIPADRYDYKNVGHADSPIVSATFNDGNLSRPGCTRSYSGVVGNHGYNVTLGISDMANPGAEIGNGWNWGAELGREQGVIVREVRR